MNETQYSKEPRTSSGALLYQRLRYAISRHAGSSPGKPRFLIAANTMGQRNSSTNYFYNTDHLGSVREMTDSSGVIKAQYNYDPYGQVTKLQGSQDADFQYAGYYQHGRSGLNLTLYRAYNPGLGRWISRDPIGEAGGTNLYAYVDNSAITLIDPLGLFLSYTAVPTSLSAPPLGDICEGELGEEDAIAIDPQTVMKILDALSKATRIVEKSIKAGTKMSPTVRGTKIHSEAAKLLRGKPNIHPESSFKGGRPVQYGTSGSSRSDIGVGARGNPSDVVHIKTGQAQVTRGEINRTIQSHPQGSSINQYEVNLDRGVFKRVYP